MSHFIVKPKKGGKMGNAKKTHKGTINSQTEKTINHIRDDPVCPCSGERHIILLVYSQAIWPEVSHLFLPAQFSSS